MLSLFHKIHDLWVIGRIFAQLSPKEIPSLEIFRVEVPAPEADWHHLLENTPSTLEEMVEYDHDKTTGRPRYPSGPNRLL